MNELALFSGAGGGILGGYLCGWRTVAAVEIEEYPRAVLLQRQADGILPRFPIWDDVKTFDGKPWRGKVDVITGGFPCQDISAAGKGAGITGERSGLWSEMARIISEVRPRFAFVENSPMLTSRGLGVVLGDLAEMGYYARWCVLGADDAGAIHHRKRLWLLAYTNSNRLESNREDRNIEEARRSTTGWTSKSAYVRIFTPEQHEDAVVSVRDDEPISYRVDRLKAIGNGQVPAVACLAWNILSEGLDKGESKK